MFFDLGLVSSVHSVFFLSTVIELDSVLKFKFFKYDYSKITSWYTTSLELLN